jgi:hypothetical protein
MRPPAPAARTKPSRHRAVGSLLQEMSLPGRRSTVPLATESREGQLSSACSLSAWALPLSRHWSVCSPLRGHDGPMPYLHRPCNSNSIGLTRLRPQSSHGDCLRRLPVRSAAAPATGSSGTTVSPWCHSGVPQEHISDAWKTLTGRGLVLDASWGTSARPSGVLWVSFRRSFRGLLWAQRCPVRAGCPPGTRLEHLRDT